MLITGALPINKSSVQFPPIIEKEIPYTPKKLDPRHVKELPELQLLRNDNHSGRETRQQIAPTDGGQLNPYFLRRSAGRSVEMI